MDSHTRAAGASGKRFYRKEGQLNRRMLMNSERTEGVTKVPASKIKKWGLERGVVFPPDFVDFIAEFGGIYPNEEWGYQYIPEDEDYPVFAEIGCFLHFDNEVSRHSVNAEYTDHFLTWNQPLLFPFAWAEINVHAALNFQISRRNPSIYNVEMFVASRAEPDRHNMTWLADSFTGFLDILETQESYFERNGEVYRF